MFLTDEQWSIIEPHLKIERKSVFGRPMADTRKIFEALLFVVHTGMQWEHLPRSFPPKSTVHDYLKRWCQRDRFRRLLAALIRRLFEDGRVELDQAFIEATFAPARSGGNGVGLTRKGKGTKIQVVVDGSGLALDVSSAGADTGKPQRVQQTLDLFDEQTQPPRLIGDKAYDSDLLDELLAELGIERIAPHRRNRLPENRTQDGRALRRYKHRWIVERTLSWLGYHRRLLVRWERHGSLFMGFTLLGCMMITLHRFAS
ncbi:MAG: IS5 family transposase [Opitutaceae bacterium]|jgi:transposase|nr:IS5 family transposase [Opitutaceae bacterium]